MSIKRVLFLIVTGVCFLFTAPTQGLADTVDDLTVLWPDGANTFIHTYASIPEEVKALFPSPPKWSEYPTTEAYPSFGKQCTWYVYYRAKQQGRVYGEFEGNGGYWQEPAGGTTGTQTPKAQVAASITGGGNYLGASGSPGHVVYVEYIDKKGNLLISEGNVRNRLDGGGSGGDKHENVRIIRKSDPNFDKLWFVDPANAKDLKDHGKNPDGTNTGSSTAGKDTEAEDKEKQTSTNNKPNTDDTFTINGFGSTLGKDWDEFDLSKDIPDSSSIMQLTSAQRQALADWIAESNTSKTATIISSVRTLIQVVGIGLIFLVIALTFSYLFDRVGVLDFSLLALLTGGKLYTVYDTNDDTFFNKQHQGKAKGVGIRSLLIINLIILMLSILIFNGILYEWIYILITFINDLYTNIRGLI